MHSAIASGALCLSMCLALAACDKPENQVAPESPGATQTVPTTQPVSSDSAASAPAAAMARPAPAAAPLQSEEATGVSTIVEEAQRSATVSTNTASDDAMDLVSEALRDYLRRQGAPEDGGVTNMGGKSVQFAVGQSTSAVPPGSAQFSDARLLAFERAFQDALAQLVQTRSRKIASLVSSQMMQDTSNAAQFVEACKPSADEALIMKMTQLLNAKMDAALTQLGVPDNEIAAQKPAYRCENPQLRDSITTSTRTTALSSLRGVRIVKSVTVGGEVGVVVAVSPNFVDAAQALARRETSRNPLPTAAEEIMADLQNTTGSNFLSEYGVRAAKLSNGETALFAFGQAGANLTPNDVGAFRSTKRRSAQSSATRMAEAQLAQFAKVTTYFASEEQRFAGIAQTLVTEDGVATEQQTQEVGRKLMESVRSAADLQLDGAILVKRWSVSDPDSGDLVEGIVLAWSPSLAGAIQAANRPVQASRINAAQGNRSATKHESVERQEDW